MKKFSALLAAAVVAGFAAAPAPAQAPTAVAAKTCSRGVHAVMPSGHKCLMRGQYCSRGWDRTYHRYGFHCHNRDSRGSYHLS